MVHVKTYDSEVVTIAPRRHKGLSMAGVSFRDEEMEDGTEL